MAESKVVVSPNADSTGLDKQGNGLGQVSPHFKNVTDDHDLVHFLAAESRECGTQLRHMLMNIAKQTESHMATLCAGLV